MKKTLKIFVLLLLLFIVVFYFWASAPNYSESVYSYTSGFDSTINYSSKDTLRIMTYNMGYLSGMTNNKAVDRTKDLFDSNLGDLQGLLRDLKVDVCCLQEIDFHSKRSYFVDQLEGIVEGNEYPYYAKVINWDKKYIPFPYWPPSQQFGEVLSGQAIVSEFLVLKNDRIVLAQADNPFYYNAFYLDRLAQVNLLHLGDKKLLVINVHLEAWDARAREEQANQLIGLYNQYKEQYPVLIVGDFNSTPPKATKPYMEEETIARLMDQIGLRSAISDSLYMTNESEYFTFNSSEPYIKIDYIFYDETKIKVLNSRVVKEAGEISDHLPVFAEIVILE